MSRSHKRAAEAPALVLALEAAQADEPLPPLQAPHAHALPPPHPFAAANDGDAAAITDAQRAALVAARVQLPVWDALLESSEAAAGVTAAAAVPAAVPGDAASEVDPVLEAALAMQDARILPTAARVLEHIALGDTTAGVALLNATPATLVAGWYALDYLGAAPALLAPVQTALLAHRLAGTGKPVEHDGTLARALVLHKRTLFERALVAGHTDAEDRRASVVTDALKTRAPLVAAFTLWYIACAAGHGDLASRALLAFPEDLGFLEHAHIVAVAASCNRVGFVEAACEAGEAGIAGWHAAAQVAATAGHLDLWHAAFAQCVLALPADPADDPEGDDTRDRHERAVAVGGHPAILTALRASPAGKHIHWSRLVSRLVRVAKPAALAWLDAVEWDGAPPPWATWPQWVRDAATAGRAHDTLPVWAAMQAVRDHGRCDGLEWLRARGIVLPGGLTLTLTRGAMPHAPAVAAWLHSRGMLKAVTITLPHALDAGKAEVRERWAMLRWAIEHRYRKAAAVTHGEVTALLRHGCTFNVEWLLERGLPPPSAASVRWSDALAPLAMANAVAGLRWLAGRDGINAVLATAALTAYLNNTGARLQWATVDALRAAGAALTAAHVRAAVDGRHWQLVQPLVARGAPLTTYVVCAALAHCQAGLAAWARDEQAIPYEHAFAEAALLSRSSKIKDMVAAWSALPRSGAAGSGAGPSTGNRSGSE